MVSVGSTFTLLVPAVVNKNVSYDDAWKRSTEEIRKAKMILWNGPVGLFEVVPYNKGTLALAEALADSHSRLVSIIAGGDTVAAVIAAGVEDKITHLSTGGGATLEFLEGKKLPGIEALEVEA